MVYVPLQAIAAVFGFMVTAALIIMLVFALKTRQKINNYGKQNILWKKVKVVDGLAPPEDVEAWVSDGVMDCSLHILLFEIFLMSELRADRPTRL